MAKRKFNQDFIKYGPALYSVIEERKKENASFAIVF